MTYVENIFKHGVDKIKGCNRIEISLVLQNGYLYFKTKNAISSHTEGAKPEGFGLKNLRKRLSILYGTDFEMETFNDGRNFSASLKIPVYESKVHDS